MNILLISKNPNKKPNYFWRFLFWFFDISNKFIFIGKNKNINYQGIKYFFRNIIKIYKRNHKSNIINDLININNKQKTIIRNPSKIFNPEDIKKELESYNSAAKKILLCGDEIFEIIYNKLSIDFTQIDKYLHSKNLYYNIKIKKIDILKKFFLTIKVYRYYIYSWIIIK